MEKKMNHAELAKINAEIAKLMAETSKINAEARWYPLVVTAGIFGAALAVIKVFV